MELDPQHRPLCVNQSLRKAALRPSDGLQSLTQSVHRLVVGTVHREYGAVQPVEQSALPAAYRVDPVLLPAAMERSDFSRQVLEQGAPQRHIDHLHPPADCQDWLARLKKGPEQLQLRLVSLPVRGLGAPVFLPKEGRVHIQMCIRDSISELYLNQVQEGQEVDITAEALPGQVFQGVVDRVSINGTTTNGFTTYPVTILLREFGDLNPGMNVSADIVVERTTGVLCVPVSAVNSDGTVLVAGPGTLSEDGLTIADLSKAERRPVELGRSNEEYIEITSGLSQDEVVLVPDQATGSMGAVAMGG